MLSKRAVGFWRKFSHCLAQAEAVFFRCNPELTDIRSLCSRRSAPEKPSVCAFRVFGSLYGLYIKK